MAAQALSQLRISRIEEILAKVTQEVEVANEIAYSWKDFGNGLEDAGPHVVNAGGRGPIVALELAEKGNNVVGVLTWQLYVGKHNFAQAVDSRHECRRFPFVHGIEVEDVSTGYFHSLANPRRCLLMPQGQIRYELAAEVFDFGDGKSNIAGNQFVVNFLRVAMPLKQRLPNEDQNIVGNIAATRNQPEQSIGVKGAAAKSALSHPLAGDEWSEHAQDFLTPRLLHEKPAAAGASIRLWSEPHHRSLRKEDGRHGFI
jgi:hypothetical protein